MKNSFNFKKGNVFSIYARNGLMKTSFTKTFQLIQQGKEENISDVIFGDSGTAKIKIDGNDIKKERNENLIYVLFLFEMLFGSEIL